MNQCSRHQCNMIIRWNWFAIKNKIQFLALDWPSRVSQALLSLSLIMYSTLLCQHYLSSIVYQLIRSTPINRDSFITAESEQKYLEMVLPSSLISKNRFSLRSRSPPVVLWSNQGIVIVTYVRSNSYPRQANVQSARFLSCVIFSMIYVACLTI